MWGRVTRATGLLYGASPVLLAANEAQFRSFNDGIARVLVTLLVGSGQTSACFRSSLKDVSASHPTAYSSGPIRPASCTLSNAMAFSQSAISAVNVQSNGPDLFITWSSTAAMGSLYQVYVDHRLAWFGPAFAVLCLLHPTQAGQYLGRCWRR